MERFWWTVLAVIIGAIFGGGVINLFPARTEKGKIISTIIFSIVAGAVMGTCAYTSY